MCKCRRSLHVGARSIHGYLYTYPEIPEIWTPKKSQSPTVNLSCHCLLLKVEWDQQKWYCKKIKSVCQSCQIVWNILNLNGTSAPKHGERDEIHAAGHKVESVKLELYMYDSAGFLPLFLNKKSTIGFLANSPWQDFTVLSEQSCITSISNRRLIKAPRACAKILSLQ